MQIVSENIKKDTINIVRILNPMRDTCYDMKAALDNISGKSFNYSEINADKILTLKENVLSEIDLVLVQNLSVDEYVSLYNNIFFNFSLVSWMKF